MPLTRKRKKAEPVTPENLTFSLSSSNKNNVESQHQHIVPIIDHVLNARLTNQRQVRQQLFQLRTDLECTRQFGIDPLYLFPQEIWLMIFNHVDDINDLANLPRSCTLFSTIIIGFPQELLFAKVLPFLLPYFFYKAEVLVTCGSVCRKWRSGVNRVADSIFRIKNPISSSLEALKKEPEPYYTDELRTRLFKIIPELRARRANGEIRYRIYAPFLVALQMNMSTRQPWGVPTDLATLDWLGRLLWLLNLELEDGDAYNTQQLYGWCAKALGKCQNLRTFCLFEETLFSTTILDNGIGNEGIEEVQSNSLETLELTVRNLNFVPVQDELLRHLSDRLKSLKVSIWNDQLYHNLSWTNLTEMHIVHDSRPAMLTSLEKMKAPKLHKLSLKMDCSCDLTQLFKVLQNFRGSLRHLVLLLTIAFNSESVLCVPVEMLTGIDILSLEIISHNLNQSVNIPILFSQVRNLTWSHGPMATMDPPSFNDPKTNQQFKKPIYYIQIYSNMYRSNVWTVLPNLQNLAIRYASLCPIKQEGNILHTKLVTELRKFTRDTYTWETEKYGPGIKDLLARIQTVVRAEVNEAVKTEREILERVVERMRNKARLRQVPQRKVKQGEEGTKRNFEQVFAFIFPCLANSDLKACRLVEKTWKRLVDEHYQNPDLSLSIGIPMTQRQSAKFTLDFNTNKQNPYFAHKVHLKLNKGTDKLKEVQKLLRKLGNNIRHLTISSLFSLSLIETYKVFTMCLKSCTNLESLTLHIKTVKESSEREFKKLVEAAIPLVLPKRFETLAVSGPDSTYRGAVLNLFLDEVKEKCRDKITVLVQDQSSKHDEDDEEEEEEEEAFEEMPKLKELTMRKFSTDVGSLLKLKWHWPVAPNLRKLRICITGQKIGYQDLICIAKNYQKLEFLELQFTEACSGFAGCLKYSDPSKILLKVTELKIVFKNKFQICLDFLVLFPYVKNLTIMYGKQAEFYNEESSWQPKISYGDLKPSLSLPGKKPENDYIQLAKYLKDADLKNHDSQGIYGSNIWTVLRRLGELKVVHCATEQTKRDSRIFYRQM